MEQDHTRDEDELAARLADFTKRHAPEDPEDRFRFECAIHSLIFTAYRQAAKPYERALMAAYSAMPLQNIFTPASNEPIISKREG